MSRRRELDKHRQKLVEIRDIMHSIKTLAYLETRKLSRYLAAQQVVTENIDAVATDFFTFHRDFLPTADNAKPIFLLVGTERGFCGDFNDNVRQSMQVELDTSENDKPMYICLGRKLTPDNVAGIQPVASLPNVTTVDETGNVLSDLVEILINLQPRHGSIQLNVLYHQDESATVTNEQILPPFQELRDVSDRYTYPPLLNLPLDQFVRELIDHYLYAVLHKVLYYSLMAENRRRVQHLESAIHRLDNRSDELRGKCNALRQEEIIEEIEVILLNIDSMTHKNIGEASSS